MFGHFKGPTFHENTLVNLQAKLKATNHNFTQLQLLSEGTMKKSLQFVAAKKLFFLLRTSKKFFIKESFFLFKTTVRRSFSIDRLPQILPHNISTIYDELKKLNDL